jgi:hypothetical protein
MSRTRIGAALALLALALLALPGGSNGDSSNPTWAGVWDTDFGRMTLGAGGSGTYEGFTTGTISGHVEGAVDEGTWQQGDKKGDFKFTLSGLSFTGEWHYDTGGCGTACGWSGTCIDGPCLKNNDPPPANECTPLGARASATTDYCPFAFGRSASIAAPKPGDAADISPKKLPSDAFKVLVDLIEERQAEELALALGVKLREQGLEEAFQGCIFVGFQGLRRNDDSLTLQGNRLSAVVTACARLMLRQGTPAKPRAAVRIAAADCPAVFVPAFPKGTKVTKKRRARARDAAKQQLRATCGETADKLSITLKARHESSTLRDLLGKRIGARLARFAPEGETPPAGERIGVRWRARER